MAKHRTTVSVKGEPVAMARPPLPIPPKGEPERVNDPVYLVSSLDHNVLLPYDGLTIAVPPRARHGDVKVINRAKLGALPRGIFVVPAPK
jgi:hypothetical protein